MKIIVQDNQTIYDVALQYAGSLEAVIDILEANEKTNTTLLIGEELVIPSVLAAKVSNFFNDKGVVIATSATPMEVDEWVAPEGLDRKVEISVNGELLDVVQAPGELNIEIVDTENKAVSTSVSGGKIIIDDLPTPLYYGVEWDITAATTVMTRIGNMDMHRTLPIQSQMKRALIKDDGSVNYWLDNNDSNLKDDGVTPSNLSGDDGQVMVRLPEHYRKFENQVDKRRTLLSLHPLDGFERVPERWVSAYEATVQRSTNKLSSVVSMDADYRGGNNNAAEDLSVISFLGKPASAISRINFRAYARNRGTMQWNMMLHEVRKTIFWLYYVEHANMNCQTAFNPAPTAEGYTQGGLGPGVTTVDGTDWTNYNGRYPFVPCGITNSLGNNTGVVDYSPPGWPSPITVSVPSFRGIENPFGHLWEWIDGVNIRIQADSDGGQSEIYLADSLEMSDVDYVGYTKFNNLPRHNGYMHALHHTNGEILPRSVTGASSNTFWSDYFYTAIPSSGEVLRGVLSGGRASNGSH